MCHEGMSGCPYKHTKAHLYGAWCPSMGSKPTCEPGSIKAEARQRKAEEQALGLLEHQEVSERFGWEELHGLKVHRSSVSEGSVAECIRLKLPVDIFWIGLVTEGMWQDPERLGVIRFDPTMYSRWCPMHFKDRKQTLANIKSLTYFSAASIFGNSRGLASQSIRGLVEERRVADNAAIVDKTCRGWAKLWLVAFLRVLTCLVILWFRKPYLHAPKFCTNPTIS